MSGSRSYDLVVIRSGTAAHPTGASDIGCML
jgi:hypothetical protein